MQLEDRLRKIISYVREEGLYWTFKAAMRNAFEHADLYYYKLFMPADFVFRNKTYHYFYHGYNHSWLSERTIEIPIIWEKVNSSKGKQILELGNVLSHYFPIHHDVLDKYEKAPGVINADVVDFKPHKKYDLIVSISTLEHVSWDEDVRDRTKALRAVQNLRKCLAPGGEIIITVPIGYNTDLDDLLLEGKLRFDEQRFMKRITNSNRWVEAAWKDVKNARYGAPFYATNALRIGIIRGAGKR